LNELNLNLEGIALLDLYGENNNKLNILKEAYPDVKITSRGHTLKISGDEKNTLEVKAILEKMVDLLKENHELNNQVVFDLTLGNNPYQGHIPSHQNGKVIVYGRNGKPIKARTKNQKKLEELSETNDIVFAIGPAGTGKTYTAVALAVKALKNKLVKKIILTRPAVEAGESLGFLPGDLKEKVDPYLRPLYDALDDMFPAEKLNYFMTNRVIEVAPLAFMRGRTLDHAFVILDEAQNCTTTQIKMFLTRLGPSAKYIITGDLSQIDLPMSQKSGLKRAIDLCSDIQGVGIVKLTTEDVVRHRLVKEIIKKYEISDKFIQDRRSRQKGKYEEE